MQPPQSGVRGQLGVGVEGGDDGLCWGGNKFGLVFVWPKEWKDMFFQDR